MTFISKLHCVKKSKCGATFVEILISTLILSFILISIISLFAKCGGLANDLREHLIVNNALNERMETLRGMSYSNILSAASTFTANGFAQLNDAVGTFTLEDPFSDNNIRKVTLTVTWTSSQGRSLSKSLVTLITNDGINEQ